MWFTNNVGASIGRITTAGAVTNFTDPTISFPHEIAAGSDGALWFTNYGNDSIGRITTAGAVTNYTGPGVNGPQDITAGPDGALWFTNFAGGSVGRITTAGVLTDYKKSGVKKPWGIVDGPDGAVWFANSGGASIDRISTTGTITTYHSNQNPQVLAVGPDNALWFGNEANNWLERMTTSSSLSVAPPRHAAASAGSLAPMASGASAAPFGRSISPVGLVETSAGLVVTRQGSATIGIMDANGNERTFATLPVRCKECYPAVSTGLGGFAPGDVYVAAGSHVYKVSPAGAVTLFAALPGLDSTHEMVTFDTVGTFGYAMLVSNIGGLLYSVTPSGQYTRITLSQPANFESGGVAPLTFGKYAGDLIVPKSGLHRYAPDGSIYAIDPTGKVFIIAKGLPGTESIRFVPTTTCTYGGFAYLAADEDEDSVSGYTSDAFAGLAGTAVLHAEGLSKYLVTGTATGATITAFDPTPADNEGGTFANCTG